MILCGWCGVATDVTRCVNCRRDPTLPYTQRAQEPEPVDPATTVRLRLASAERALGPDATIAAVAEYLDVSDRTVRRWRGMVK